LNLTVQNGIHVSIDREKINSISPHIDGGSVIITTNGNSIHVVESVNEILSNK